MPLDFRKCWVSFYLSHLLKSGQIQMREWKEMALPAIWSVQWNSESRSSVASSLGSSHLMELLCVISFVSCMIPSNPHILRQTLSLTLFYSWKRRLREDQSHMAGKSHCSNPGSLTPDSSGSQDWDFLVLIKKHLCNWWAFCSSLDLWKNAQLHNVTKKHRW